MKLEKSFYQSPDVCGVAMNLLGKVLYVRTETGVCAGMIVETEAYSYKERACHAFNNRRTARTETLFADGGTSYVYLCYGIHHLFNVVTNEQDVAEAVLIRALEPVMGIQQMKDRRNTDRDEVLTSGPGKLSQAMGITLANNCDSLTGSDIWIEDAELILPKEIISGPRIGVDYAGEDAQLPWRFGIKGNAYISRPFPE